MRVTDIKNINMYCTGCNACINKCPLKAIKNNQDEEGFWYPVIDVDACVNCGMCASVCHILYDTYKSGSYNPFKVVSCYAKDSQQRMLGSSGGFFGLLAENIVKGGGVVYGAAFDSHSKKVIHTSSDETPLEKLYRSKYVQSDIQDCLKEVEKNLIANRNVLFCGTPCQCSGLLHFLGRPYDNLFLIDFICHGVPSPGLFQDMINREEKDKNKTVENITFREKNDGWRELAIRIYYSDGTIESERSKTHPYYMTFLNNYSLRKSCYSCERCSNRYSDITLADNWTTKMQDNKGTSLIMINSNKGIQLFDSIYNHLVIEPETYSYISKRYSHRNYSLVKRTSFFKNYKELGYDNAMEIAVQEITKKNNSNKHKPIAYRIYNYIRSKM